MGLATLAGTCKSGVMTPERPNQFREPAGGGCLVAAGLILGPVIGMAIGNGLIGLVIGAGAGIAAAVGLAVWDKRH